MKIALAVLAGLISVALTEAVAVVWMINAPASIDLVGHFFVLTVLPAVTVVVLINALALWRVFKANPVRYPLIYSGVYLIAQAIGLNQLGNPPDYLLLYAATVAIVCAVVFFLFSRFAWPR